MTEFNLYVEEIDKLFSEIEIQIEGLSQTTGASRKESRFAIENKLGDAKQMLDELNGLVQELSSDERYNKAIILTNMRGRLQKNKQAADAFSRQISDSSEMRRQLLGKHTDGDIELGDLDGIEKMKKNTSQLEDGTEIINNMLLVANSTTDVASGTVSELSRQGDVLFHARSTSGDIHDDLGSGAGILRPVF
ncbi:MAG: hypothetical protein EZS28_000919 [Streblomastix strix]|uniref:Vesicle transport v-SNARE N-terminal domain-containing protein n=1 Tax=Streblomastix strix TaxID=222440 RepID=A0A5J4X8N9_9EUKA|nr:MAG: hypothetical protein EZS28_000919 [Streblomastix strix]